MKKRKKQVALKQFDKSHDKIGNKSHLIYFTNDIFIYKNQSFVGS